MSLEGFWFPYSGSMKRVNDDDSVSEEITHRMKKGNRAHYAYKGLITSILINKYNKNDIHMALIMPEVIHKCENWNSC